MNVRARARSMRYRISNIGYTRAMRKDDSYHDVFSAYDRWNSNWASFVFAGILVHFTRAVLRVLALDLIVGGKCSHGVVIFFLLPHVSLATTVFVLREIEISYKRSGLIRSLQVSLFHKVPPV